MWDTIETSGGRAGGHLSHDLPCAACGHAPHRFLACSDSCACVPPPLPGVLDARRLTA
ncbi:hypothetical protein [Nocardioides perillae]|uniref:Uncharacterized protein n=1 Tax=Nocardioides perillae TaxID=1119534 RepID=A0A7Y9UKZ5_9ACTN|nr:hypothetical protein [Nocardioides perillae]NYG55888.1 hypothetical protein [Nocardioides perillae]